MFSAIIRVKCVYVLCQAHAYMRRCMFTCRNSSSYRCDVDIDVDVVSLV